MSRKSSALARALSVFGAALLALLAHPTSAAETPTPEQVTYKTTTVDGYRHDLKNVTVHLFDTGHFALEEDVTRIAPLVRQFMLSKTDHGTR